MAYTMIHILVADEIWKIRAKEGDYATYLCGVIAPDAVHAEQDYTSKKKEQSHLFAPNLQWGKISTLEKAETWLNQIRIYFFENQNRYNPDFLLGYMIHLLVDVFNSLYYYTPAMKALEREAENQKAIYKRQQFELNRFLFLTYEHKKELKDVLKMGNFVTMENVITRESIKRRIDQLFETELTEQSLSLNIQQTCQEASVDRLIRAAVEFCMGQEFLSRLL